jgi:hypothetical protein
MATRSRIGIENEDGTVSSIYSHWDGYPSHNGRILVDHYSDRDKVKALIALGDISSLDEEVSTEDSHSLESPKKGVTTAYHRDRGEDLNEARVDHSIYEYLVADNEEYGYLFTREGEWKVSCYGREFESVKELLKSGE